MNRRKGFVMIAVLVLALAAGSAGAQELQLKESDIRKLIPLLRAEAAGLGAAQSYYERQEAARTGFSGDPLDFLSNRAKIEMPQGARYVADCSRTASAGGPVAIFTLGRTIDCFERAWRDAFRHGPPKAEPVVSQDCYAQREQMQKFIDGVQGALEEKGYTVLSDAKALRDLASADGHFTIALYSHNIYDRANRPDDHPLFLRIESEVAREAALAACSNMPSGPIIAVSPGDRFFEKEPLDALDIVLQKAGLSAKDYEAMKEALILARMDTQPEWLQAAEAAAGSDPAALRALAIRRTNAELYGRFASELGPLLDALVPRQ